MSSIVTKYHRAVEGAKNSEEYYDSLTSTIAPDTLAGYEQQHDNAQATRASTKDVMDYDHDKETFKKKEQKKLRKQGKQSRTDPMDIFDTDLSKGQFHRKCTLSPGLRTLCPGLQQHRRVQRSSFNSSGTRQN